MKPRHTPTDNKAEATGRLPKTFLCTHLTVPFVPKETSLGTKVVSEHTVKVKQSQPELDMHENWACQTPPLVAQVQRGIWFEHASFEVEAGPSCQHSEFPKEETFLLLQID